jgi:ribosomal protein S18 acetylase RimI-like enzyme
LAPSPAFRHHALRPAERADEDAMYALHRDAMRAHIDAIWGWNEEWQRAHFAAHYAPAHNAIIVRCGTTTRDVGRISLTRHWRKIFLRDIELAAAARNHGLGSAIVTAVLLIARAEARRVELLVLHGNPAQRLYARLGFKVVGDDGARLRMRAE